MMSDTSDAGSALTWVEPPAHVDPDLVIRFDVDRDPEVNAHPWESVEKLRSKPIWWTQAPPTDFRAAGSWIPTRARDIRFVFQHPAIFSSENPDPMQGAAKLIPIQMDPPEHTKYRQLIAAAFSPPAVRNLDKEIRQRAVELIDAFAAEGQCDFVHSFAQPFPTALFCKIMGIPFDKIDQFLIWNRIIIHGSDFPLKEQTVTDVSTYLASLIAERKSNPEDDLISHLVHRTVDGEAIDLPTLVNMGILLFMAGLDTVTASLSWSVHHLATHAEQHDALVADPGLIAGATEEMLRCYAIVNPPRFATRDVELAGVTIHKGDKVHILTSLGTGDADEFDGADVMDFTRVKNPHMAFGLGPHRCVGSHLARAELIVGLEELLGRLPNFRVAGDEELPAHAGPVFGLDRLPLEWDLR
jgi:cytochrome P450